MRKMKSIATIFTALLIVALMAAPAFAQSATPDPTATPTVEPEGTQTATPTPTPEEQTSSTVTPTPAAGEQEATATPTSATSSDDQSQPGEVMGRGLFGPVVAVGDSSLTVSTKKGNVVLTVTSDTKITQAPTGAIALSGITVGSRVAVLMDKAPTSDGAATPTFSGATAISIHVIPAKAVHTHEHAVVTKSCADSGDGTMTVATPSGNEITLQCNGNNSADGTDTILLTSKEGKGKPDRVVGATDPSTIRQRLEDLKAKADQQRAAILNRLETEQEAQITQRLDNIASRVPAAVRTKIENAKTRIEDAFAHRDANMGGSTGTPTPGSGSNGAGSEGAGNSMSVRPTGTPTPESSGKDQQSGLPTGRR